MLSRIIGKFSYDLGIDLGTANTLVSIRGQGIVINEPSIVAINRKTNSIVAIGAEAQVMYGRTPQHIEAVRPLIDGVISDFEVTEEMLRSLIARANTMVHTMNFFGPRVVVGIPSGTTNVEARAVIDAARNAGAREVYLIEEPMAAAIGVGLPVTESIGTMVIDIGGGTTDIAVISLAGIVVSKNIKIAGDRFNQDIVHYVRDAYQVLIGERTAEFAKIQLASAVPLDDHLEIPVRGRDLATGLPRELLLTRNDVALALSDSISVLIGGIKEVLELTPPEIISDIMHKGILLTGGGALIRHLDHRISMETGMPCSVAVDPLSAVARGAAAVLEEFDRYREVLQSDAMYDNSTATQRK